MLGTYPFVPQEIATYGCRTRDTVFVIDEQTEEGVAAGTDVDGFDGLSQGKCFFTADNSGYSTPMVLTCSPMSATASVSTSTATSEPGIFLLIFGHTI